MKQLNAHQLNTHKVGLALGAFGALVHLVWSLLVALVPAALQWFLDWVVVLHQVRPIYVLLQFNAMNAVILIALVFVMWYVLGWVFATIWNKVAT